uniref:Reverse transcriptase zinc-binding domain-containing protein n=1 Tax=Denticeps clupeoides TaxID=299321 RepID=A0AAY4AMN0_9TELE
MPAEPSLVCAGSGTPGRGYQTEHRYKGYIDKWLESLFLNTTNAAHFISKFYSFLYANDSGLVSTVARKWEEDLGNVYIDDDWQEAMKSVRYTFVCNRLRETQYKILHRLHITPVLMNKIDSSVPALCVKCHTELGTYFHCFWGCRLISRFWNFVAHEISTILKIKLKADPGLFLLGLPSKRQATSLKLDAKSYRLLDKLLLVARKCILIRWIKNTPPSVTQWYREIFAVLPHERLAAVLRDNINSFQNVWSPFLDHLSPNVREMVLCNPPAGPPDNKASGNGELRMCRLSADHTAGTHAPTQTHTALSLNGGHFRGEGGSISPRTGPPARSPSLSTPQVTHVSNFAARIIGPRDLVKAGPLKHLQCNNAIHPPPSCPGNTAAVAGFTVLYPIPHVRIKPKTKADHARTLRSANESANDTGGRGA